MKPNEYLDEISYLFASSLSRKILITINILSFTTPTVIAKIIKTSPSNVSTKLIKLREKGLVVCLTPERKKGRIYGLTKKGEYVIKFFDGYKAELNLNRELFEIKYVGSKIKRL
ncbi:MAG: hypothetical protein N3D78_02310 [Candidatus Aenigmarchaeota archaeon]|nr:hypothetical protein [Candidatus Aenigmarchaeota archaeon]